MRSPTLPYSPTQVEARILSSEVVAPAHVRMCLHAPTIAANAQAGQFVHVLGRSYTISDPFLRRAFSILSAHGDQIEILFRVGGKGTTYLSTLQPGEIIDLLGPLGHAFDLSPLQKPPSSHIVSHETMPRPLLVGGGVGVPPMVFLSQTLLASNITPLILIGARSAAEILGETDFSALGIPLRMTTDDGSLGHAGRITDLLEEELRNDPKAVVYACGPLPMLRAVAAIAARYAVPCQVSLEENMPCGIGVCNGCVVATKPVQGSSDYERYERICVAGPMLWADRVDWEAI